jgi:UDP-2-acetamido-3-amino-2,3-dideoxy-glucuronate N-acetyltransferase
MERSNSLYGEFAIVDSENIGAGTRIWSFTHVMARASIGQDCNIGENVFIENDVLIGDRVTIKNGVQIWDGITIGNDVFIGPNVTFTNDKFPKSRSVPDNPARTTVQDNVTIGANSTILPGLLIEKGSFIGAGAVVTKNVPPYTLMLGNPAKLAGPSPHIEN